MPKWRDPPDIRSADGKYHLKEFCVLAGGRRDGSDVFIHMPTRTFWTAEQIDALFPQGVPGEPEE